MYVIINVVQKPYRFLSIFSKSKFFFYFSSETSTTVTSQYGAPRVVSTKWSMQWRQWSWVPPPSVWKTNSLLCLLHWNERSVSSPHTRRRLFPSMNTLAFPFLGWLLMQECLGLFTISILLLFNKVFDFQGSFSIFIAQKTIQPT